VKKLIVFICFCLAGIPMVFGQDENITAMEYYIDTDPGVGNGTAIAFTSGASVSFTLNIPTASLSVGMHVLVIRAQDDDGVWGIFESRAFYVSSTTVGAVANVTSMEYFFDSDPGVGNATLVSITAATSVNIFQSINVSSLAAGFHVIHYRARDSDGAWGVTESRVFYLTPSGLVSQATITNVEYFFDAEPGYGNGTAIPITSATTLNMQAIVATAALPKGFHTLHIRARDNDGVWGQSEKRSFFIDEFGLITKVEYFIDVDPGVGSATQIPVSPPVASIDLNVSIPTTSLSPGAHSLGVRIQTANTTWNDADIVPFNICSTPTADFSANTTCLGSATTFTDNSTTVAGDVYQWDFDSNGTVDASTVGNAAFTYPAAGTYTATLTIDRTGCTDVATVMVTVEPVPTANAGIDQNICTDNTTLSSNAPATGETATWSLISGSGTITNLTDPVSTITGITSSSITLQWTVTNTLAGCSVSDQVVVISNQPIVAALVNINASLGQTVNANVQSPATINSGDVLTTTIVTPPGKGIASVLANGTINYTPNAGTVGLDVVTFQLCNQCAKCSSNNLQITIQNNAPVIVPDPITVTTGDTVSFNLLSIVSDPNNNLDPASLTITQQPISGAVASIDASFNLIINYENVVFTGTDQLIVEACDTQGACSSNTISIEVDLQAAIDPPIIVYNAVSPNGDSKHDFLEIENITAYPANIVYIFNRWGDKVFEVRGYDNAQTIFDGRANKGGGGDLPGGTYFYSIHLGGGRDEISGFLVLKK
jgi:gliding motility-associated-like protein